MKLTLPNINPVQALFYCAGLFSTAASVKGTLGYLMTETSSDLLLSGAGAFCLGAAAYFGWEVVFNHKGLGRRLAALLIAASASCLGAYTVYQHTAYPELERQASAAEAQAQAATEHGKQVEATLRQQQADLRGQIGALRQQNEADTRRANALDNSSKKSTARQAANLREVIAGREADISKLSAQVENYTQRLTTPATGKPGAQANTQEPLVLSWAMLARASIYDLMTALFLLFGGWFREDKRRADRTEASQLQALADAAAVQAEALQQKLAQAEKTVVRLEAGMLRAAQPIAHATECAMEPNAHVMERALGCAMAGNKGGTQEVTEQDILLLLKNRRIDVDNDGLITTETVMGLTGWGRRRAKKCKESAYQQGLLARDKHSRGWVYFYPKGFPEPIESVAKFQQLPASSNILFMAEHDRRPSHANAK